MYKAVSYNFVTSGTSSMIKINNALPMLKLGLLDDDKCPPSETNSRFDIFSITLKIWANGE